MSEADLAGILRLPDAEEAPSNLDERSDVVLAFARVLYENGQSTQQTLAAADQLAGAIGLRASVLARWGELQLRTEEDVCTAGDPLPP